MNSDHEVHKWRQEDGLGSSSKTWGWPGLGFRCGGGPLGAFGLGIDANGSNMKCETQAGIRDGFRGLD